MTVSPPVAACWVIATFPPSIEKDSVNSCQSWMATLELFPAAFVATRAYFLNCSVAFTTMVCTLESVTGLRSNEVSVADPQYLTSLQVWLSFVA